MGINVLILVFLTILAPLTSGFIGQGCFALVYFVLIGVSLSVLDKKISPYLKLIFA